MTTTLTDPPQDASNDARSILHSTNTYIMTATAALIPVRTGIDYLPHQETGIRWMMGREEANAPICRGGILGDDMGLGKTFQTIGLLKNAPTQGPTLIVCPPALIAGWKEELTACGYGVCMLIGPGAWSPSVGGKEGAETVWLTTYPKLCMNRAFVATSVAWVRVVLDEGHVIRNGKATSRWMSCMAVAAKVQCRWILSATPVQNDYADWRNLCWWLRVRCRQEEIADIGPTVMLRRTMGELRDAIAALPAPPRFVEHELAMPVEGRTAAEGRMFRALRDQLDAALSDRNVGNIVVLELYLRMQQFLVHPQLYIQSMRNKFKGAYPRPDWRDTATKWNAVMAELQDGVRANVGQIVFCMFRQEIDMVETAAAGMGAVVRTIRGGMGHEKVGEAVNGARAAATSGKPVVVVVQIVSGGAGLNLQFCERIHFLSQHWNPAVVHQAVGRAVRIGQKAVVQVHMYRIVDDVLDNIDRLMVQKHLVKIEGAKEICESLYEGFAPLAGTVAAAPLSKLLRETEDQDEDEDEDEDDDVESVGSDLAETVSVSEDPA
jgi:SNF2 family DNA or RNA helicase